MEKYVEKALKIACTAHKGQVDKAGNDYILHPIYVAFLMHNDKERAAALLHDVVEDTDVTFEDLEKAEIPEDVIEALKILTHDKSVDYLTYINIVKKNKIAKAVKIGDLTHNSDLTRLKKITQTDLDRLDKYTTALNILNNEEN